MGILEKAKRAFNNFYGGSDEEPEDDEDEYSEQDEMDNESNGSELNNGEENNDELNNHEGNNEELNNREEENEDGKTEENNDKNKENADDKPQKSSLLGGVRKKLSRAQMALMKKEAITHGCSHRLEKMPCPVCHQRSIYKSLRPFDWFPLLIGARIAGVELYRYYCFNKKCPKSWYMNYVFNCASPQFMPVAAPTKRQFNSI